MGVDISLHIEIRRGEKWQLMVIESSLLEKNNEFPIFDTEVYNCRYYHFREFLNEAESHMVGNRERLSEELRALTSIGCSSIPDSDIRIFYLVC